MSFIYSQALEAAGDDLDNMLSDRTAPIFGEKGSFAKVPLYTHPVPAQPTYRIPFRECEDSQAGQPTQQLSEEQEREAFVAWAKDEDRKNPTVPIFQDKIGIEYSLGRMMFTAFKAGISHGIGGEK